MTSWTCLMVEDCDQRHLVDIYTWVYISGLLSAFFAPLAGLMVGRFQLVPTVRMLYVFAFIMMTAKFIILYIYSTETGQGKIRLEETRHQSIFTLLRQYGGVFRQILGTPETMLTLGIMLVMSIYNMVNNTFWSMIVTKKIGIPVEIVGLFPFLRAIVMLAFFFAVMPRIRAIRFKKPMLIGFCLFICSQLLLISAPEKGYAFLVVSIMLEACGIALVNPLMDSMQVTNVDPQERARIMAILYVIIISLTSPFGWIAGILSEIDRMLPFVMNIVLFLTGAVLTYWAAAISQRKMDAGVNI